MPRHRQVKRLVLVRHGESAWNVELRIQGQSGTGLSERGRRQAEETARWLAEAYPDARIWSSDLQRCVETATPLSELLGRDAELDPALRERDFGRWTGRLVTEVAREEEAVWRRWGAGEDVVGEIGGEGNDLFGTRVVDALHRVVGQLDGASVAVCITHGGPIWHGTRALLELSRQALGGVANTSVTEIVVGDDWGMRLATWNQVGHLPSDLRAWPRAADVPRAREREAAPPVGT